jgi:hypothetical protein
MIMYPKLAAKSTGGDAANTGWREYIEQPLRSGDAKEFEKKFLKG